MTLELRNRYPSSAIVWSKASAAATLAVGALVLAGWWLNIEVLKSILPGAPAMKANSALAFLLAGLALWLLQTNSADRRLLAVRRVCAGLVALIGLLTLAEYAFGWQLGIDQLLARDLSASAGLFPGRAAALTALNFVLLGLALLLLDASSRYRLAQLFALASGLVALLALIGYLYGADSLYRPSAGNAMALHAAITFLILSLGLLLVRPSQGWMAIVTSNSAGGTLARRLLPAAVVVPVVLGWLRLQGQNAGLYDMRFGLALFATSNILVFTGLIAASAGSLFRTDMARQQAENKINRLNADLEQRVLERTFQLMAANHKLEIEAAERERTKAALAESLARLVRSESIGHMGNWEWVIPLDRVVWSDGLYQVFGLAPQEFGATYAAFLERVHPDDRERVSSAVGSALSEPRAFEFENRIVRPDGAVRDLSTRLEVVLDDHGQPSRMAGVALDITDRKQAEAALRNSEAKLRALFDVLPVGITILDRERHILDANPALERILAISKDGLAKGDYAGRDYIHPDGTTVRLEELPSARAFDTQQAVLDCEMGVVLETGQTVWTSASAVPLPEAGLGVVVVTTDITERRQIEAALAHERDLLQALLDNIPDTIYFKDTASRFTRINLAQARVLGVSQPQDAYGKTDADFQASSLASEFSAEEERIFQTGLPVVDRQEFNPTSDGQDRWFSATKVRMMDRQGRVQGLIGISRDITQRIQAEKGQRQANAALTERVGQMSLLHELEEQLQACLIVAEVYQVTAQLVSQLFADESGALYVINSSRNWVETASAWGAVPPAAQVFGLDDCWALRRGRTHLSGQAYPTQVVCGHLKGAQPALSACIPMLAQGETQGILHLRSAPGSMAPGLDEGLIQLTRVVADSVALAMANLNLREKLRQQSIRDPLTNLYNRRYMEESLERELLLAARRGRPVGVIMLDLDHFKQVNDLYGHGVGDAALRQLGRYLTENTRGGDIACRYGGEEFTLILPEANIEQARLRAEKHRQAFKALPLEYAGGLMAAITLSFGVAAFPDNGQTGEDLLREADKALYRAKHEGRDRVVVAAQVASAGQSV